MLCGGVGEGGEGWGEGEREGRTQRGGWPKRRPPTSPNTSPHGRRQPQLPVRCLLIQDVRAPGRAQGQGKDAGLHDVHVVCVCGYVRACEWALGWWSSLGAWARRPAGPSSDSEKHITHAVLDVSIAQPRRVVNPGFQAVQQGVQGVVRGRMVGRVRGRVVVVGRGGGRRGRGHGLRAVALSSSATSSGGSVRRAGQSPACAGQAPRRAGGPGRGGWARPRNVASASSAHKRGLGRRRGSRARCWRPGAAQDKPGCICKGAAAHGSDVLSVLCVRVETRLFSFLFPFTLHSFPDVLLPHAKGHTRTLC